MEASVPFLHVNQEGKHSSILAEGGEKRVLAGEYTARGGRKEPAFRFGKGPGRHPLKKKKEGVKKGEGKLFMQGKRKREGYPNAKRPRVTIGKKKKKKKKKAMPQGLIAKRTRQREGGIFIHPPFREAHHLYHRGKGGGTMSQLGRQKAHSPSFPIRRVGWKKSQIENSGRKTGRARRKKRPNRLWKRNGLFDRGKEERKKRGKRTDS